MNRSQTKTLLKYYHGILMGIDTFCYYKAQCQAKQLQSTYEEILLFYEKLQLQITNRLDQAEVSFSHSLPAFQQLSSHYTHFKIKRIADDQQLWLKSQSDYQLGLDMMQRFLAKHQKDLPITLYQLIVQQIQETYQMGKALNLIP